MHIWVYSKGRHGLTLRGYCSEGRTAIQSNFSFWQTRFMWITCKRRPVNSLVTSSIKRLNPVLRYKYVSLKKYFQTYQVSHCVDDVNQNNMHKLLSILAYCTEYCVLMACACESS